MTTFMPFARSVACATVKVRLSLFVSVLLVPICSLAQSSGAAKSTETLATVGGQPVTEDDLLPSIASKLIALRNLEYQMKEQALDNLIDQRLLEAEAKRRACRLTRFLNKRLTPR
jgi:hypothetical protein